MDLRSRRAFAAVAHLGNARLRAVELVCDVPRLADPLGDADHLHRRRRGPGRRRPAPAGPHRHRPPGGGHYHPRRRARPTGWASAATGSRRSRPARGRRRTSAGCTASRRGGRRGAARRDAHPASAAARPGRRRCRRASRSGCTAWVATGRASRRACSTRPVVRSSWSMTTWRTFPTARSSNSPDLPAQRRATRADG